MDSQPKYTKDRGGSSTYYPLHSPAVPMRWSMDSSQLSGPVKGMHPSVLDNPPQVLEIDPSSSTSLQSPSNSLTWDSPTFAAHGFADTSTYGPPPSTSTRQVQVDHHSRGRAQNRLIDWYVDNDGPWIPKSSISEVSDERQPRILQDSRLPFQHGDPYGQRIPSDTGSYQFGVPTSDSGYVTRRSDGNASVFSSDGPDRDQDSQSFRGRPLEFQNYPTIEEGFPPHDTHLNDWQLPPDVMESSNPSGRTFVCHRCQKSVKTKSELKKHDLRHTKPFVCDYPGCARVEGFSTSNDLDRHTKSKHPSVILSSEATKRYRCLVPGCKSKEKSWPRLDNFRSHLKRVHSKDVKHEDEFEELVRRASYSKPAASRTNLYDGFSQDQPLLEPSQPASSTFSPRTGKLTANWNDQYPEELQPGPDFALPSLKESPEDSKGDLLPHGFPTRYNSLSGDTIQPLDTLQTREQLHNDKLVSRDDTTAPVSLIQIVSDRRFDSGAQARGPNALDKAEGRHSATVDVITQAIKAALIGDTVPAQDGDPAQPHSPQWTQRPCQRAPEAPKSPTEADIKPGASPSSSDVFTDAEAQRTASEVLKTLRLLGYIVQKDPTSSPPKFNAGSVASSKSDKVATCPKCSKFKGRPCELKKHMKRHSRPYGCTFPACNNKTFGSKNDWKRHENSQHFHLESWRCDEEKPEGGVCAKVCYRKQTFTDHLQKDHSISNGDDLVAKAQSCHIGRNSQARFWCGFCVKLIDLKKKSVEAWAERFDHIDDHFMGRHGQKAQSIGDWVPVDSSSQAERQASPPLDYLSTSSHGDGEESPGSTNSRSPNESSPEPADIAGSSSEAGLLYPQEGSKRKRAAEDDKEGPERQRRRKSFEFSHICCCQCETIYNRKLNQHCTVCDDSHKFCDNCVKQNMEKSVEQSVVSLSRS